MKDWCAPEPDSQFMSIDGLRMHYKRTGQGPALVLLHGSGSSTHGFERVSALLSDAAQVIRPDLPGFGLTGPRPDRDYRIATYSTTIDHFLIALGVDQAVIVGNSLGGNIAWNLALDHPRRAPGLVLINATGYPEKAIPAAFRAARNPILRPLLRRWTPRRATERNLCALAGPHSHIVDDAMVDRVYSLANRPGNRTALVDFANTDQPDRSREIPRITAPTLVLRSASLDGQHFARDIPESRELVHPDGGHLLPEEDPDWVASAIRDFIASAADNDQRPERS